MREQSRQRQLLDGGMPASSALAREWASSCSGDAIRMSGLLCRASACSSQALREETPGGRHVMYVINEA